MALLIALRLSGGLFLSGVLTLAGGLPAADGSSKEKQRVRLGGWS
jgi:hypothetical protein